MILEKVLKRNIYAHLNAIQLFAPKYIDFEAIEKKHDEFLDNIIQENTKKMIKINTDWIIKRLDDKYGFVSLVIHRKHYKFKQQNISLIQPKFNAHLSSISDGE